MFVRFAGCNVWSGREQDRARDTEKGCCAAWCDTTFSGVNGTHGGRYIARDLAALVMELWSPLSRPFEGPPLIICTGGEPSLQLDDELVEMFHAIGARVHVETNGSKRLPKGVDWITLSPKPPMPVVAQAYDEVKVVYPAGFDPRAFEDYAPVRFVQPLDTLARRESANRCVKFVLETPGWQLSTQTHKALGLR